MDDYALVLNAGSSSLKFCVFQRPQGQLWQLEARGQIEGIGTSPHLKAKGGDGQILVDGKPALEVNDGNDAVEALAVWLRSKYGGSRVLGVGRRIRRACTFAAFRMATKWLPSGSRARNTKRFRGC